MKMMKCQFSEKLAKLRTCVTFVSTKLPLLQRVENIMASEVSSSFSLLL